MKYLMTAIALTALAAAPAFAASHRYTRHMPAEASNAYASAFDRNAVVEDGKVIGSDPDANVRLELRRDFGTLYNGGN